MASENRLRPLFDAEGNVVFFQRFPSCLQWVRSHCNQIDQCHRKKHYEEYEEALRILGKLKQRIVRQKEKGRFRPAEDTLNVYPCDSCGWYVVGNMSDEERRYDTERVCLKREAIELINDMRHILMERIEQLEETQGEGE